ncbi:MAG: hypothetical protein K2L95_01750 [Alphaproteobacteria bacterium]|nr:hypothetical protein [Alphaproteobacteria bacterium]
MKKATPMNADLKWHLIAAINHSIIQYYSPEKHTICLRMHVCPDDALYIQLRPTSIKIIDENTLELANKWTVTPQFNSMGIDDLRLLRPYLSTYNPVTCGIRAAQRFLNRDMMQRRYASMAGWAHDMYTIYAAALARAGCKKPNHPFDKVVNLRIAAFLRNAKQH